MIKIENIGKVFNPHSRNRNEVLKGVSFELPENGLVAIYGKSGSGKTTLLNILGGLEKQDSGKIYIDGKDISGNVDKIRNSKIGFIFQNYYLESGYTIAEIMRNAMLIAGFRDEKEIERRTHEVLNIVDMERFKNKQGDALSGGQKQRVAIARALIKGADIILADEPTGNLDAENTLKVMDILKRISKSRLVVLVTHEITLIEKYADSHIKIVDGRIAEDDVLGETYTYVTDKNKLYVDENSARRISEEGVNIQIYGNPDLKDGDLQIIGSGGEVYIRAGRNVTILDDAGEKKVVFGKKEKEKEKPASDLPEFSRSDSKRNGRLFTFAGTLKRAKDKSDERIYSTANIFKQVFIAVNAVIMCFFALASFEVLNITVRNKILDSDAVYVNMNSYSDLRTLDTNLYESVDFFETGYKEGSFSYGGISSLSGIKTEYVPKAIESGDTAESLGLVFGEMPEDGEVLISTAMAESLKSLLRIKELDSDKAMLLVTFGEGYRVSGITVGDELAVYLNKEDYVNYLGVYNTVSLSDYNNLLLSSEYADATFTAEILTASSGIQLADNEVRIEINRNSLYKMMSDVTQADFTVNTVNSILASVSGTSTAIQITGSKPMYVQRFEITRDVMTTDIRIYVNQTAMDNIFVYLQPNLDALGTSSDSQYYFEIKTDGGEQLSNLKNRLSERGIASVDVNAIYEREKDELISDTVENLSVFAIVTVLLLIIYYFTEKSGSIKNSKEYGVLRAIGVNRSNLLFKETVSAVRDNIVGYFVFYVVTAVLMCVRYAVMNVTFGAFAGLLAAVFAVSAIVLIAISLIPYLFVLWQSPAKILSRFDI